MTRKKYGIYSIIAIIGIASYFISVSCGGSNNPPTGLQVNVETIFDMCPIYVNGQMQNPAIARTYSFKMKSKIYTYESNNQMNEYDNKIQTFTNYDCFANSSRAKMTMNVPEPISKWGLDFYMEVLTCIGNAPMTSNSDPNPCKIVYHMTPKIFEDSQNGEVRINYKDLRLDEVNECN